MIEGRCLCGAVTVRVEDRHETEVGACHCGMCRRWSGGVFLCFRAEADAVSMDGPVVRYPSSSFAERAFCGTCGSHLWMRDTDRADQPYDLMPGLFEAAHGWPLRSEIYIDRAMASVRLSGDHRRETRAQVEAAHPFVEGDAR